MDSSPLDTPPAANTRSRTRPSQLVANSTPSKPLHGTSSFPTPRSPTKKSTRSKSMAARSSPFLPTSLETALIALFPVILLFGTLFSYINPSTRSAPYNVITQSHSQEAGAAPNYFARKDNLLNIWFVKKGWLWISLSFALFVATHPFLAPADTKSGSGGIVARRKQLQAGLRFGLVTIWWFFVTKWFFGPAIVDRGFRYTGGKCDVAEAKVESGDADVADAVTAVACKGAGGMWRGGHDISGHVFMLVLGTIFLVQEVGWVARRWMASQREERSVIMRDGAVKSADTAAERVAGYEEGMDVLGYGGKAIGVVVVLSLWMLLMTAIYFHTWFEKLTGLLVALVWLYAVYIVPRFVPQIRTVVGMPGI